jgi:hypothetical protein
MVASSSRFGLASSPTALAFFAYLAASAARYSGTESVR